MFRLMDGIGSAGFSRCFEDGAAREQAVSIQARACSAKAVSVADSVG
jgi:hypothetical protein